MKTYTKQEAYNKAARHIMTQGKPSIENGVCKYRGPDGAQCAFGPFIPNKLYRKSMEANTASQLIDGIVPVRDNSGGFARSKTGATKYLKAFPVRISGADTREALFFFSRLQQCHDRAALQEGPVPDKVFLYRYVDRMKFLAAQNGLNADVFDEFPSVEC